ncbi:MAG: AraC family transcriptional regulator [Bacteroidota bacterium]|nr:AraC family transcriptional regulator [Bacteroidota bacterium]
MSYSKPYRVKSISEFHKLRGLPKPEHPLVSVINLDDVQISPHGEPQSLILEFYSISIKRCLLTKFKYGQQEYDFDEGVMFFIAPGQVFAIEVQSEVQAKRSGWVLLIHPDFLWNTALAKSIKQYEYFDYAVNEALFLSEKEEANVVGIMQNILLEYHSNIDKFSQAIIIAQIELLLTYAERFYQRQFITRKITNHQVLNRLEELLNAYFDSDELSLKGLPSVQYIAEALNVSPNYLSGLLKVLTGLTTQQHIHEKLITKAKEKLSTTELTISEIAYELGFEHPQSFSKFFKTKTLLSPLAFRQSFN